MIQLGYPIPDNEIARLAALRESEIVSAVEPGFDAVVALASQVFNVPIALVSLLGEHQQIFKASVGIDVGTTERCDAFCNYAVASGSMFVVDDATKDPRFDSNPLVVGSPRARFYAGVPFGAHPGLHLGTICVLDTKPRTFSEDDARLLGQMAAIVARLARQHLQGQAIARLARDVAKRESTILDQEMALARGKSLFNRASVLTKSGAWDWNLVDGTLTWTDGMYELHEMPIGAPIAVPSVHCFYDDASRQRLEALYAQSDTERRGFTFEGDMVTAKGNKRSVRLMVDVECQDGVVIRRYGVKQDITDQKALWDGMRYLADFDPLTGLANRSTFQQKIANLAERAVRPTVTLLLIDLDGFKDINDTYGHLVGDECLKKLALRLGRVCGQAESIARLGSDEFAILLEGERDPSSLHEFIVRVLALLKRPVGLRGQTFQLSASIGVSLSGDANGSLFMEADLALHAAKSVGRNTYRQFAPAMKADADARVTVIKNIATALKRKQLELFYQPKINLSEGSLAGFEALLRWRTPEGRVVAAGEFAAALEDPELSARLGDWVVDTALSQAQAWQKAGARFGHIAINLNSSQLHDPGFASRLIEDVKGRGLRPQSIEVEITEGIFLDQDAGRVGKGLQSLHDAGIRIALDDFGTGYASLVHLRSYPIDLIKIDKSFVQRFLTSTNDHAIVQSALFLARHLALDVVAEGVETCDQRDFLKALGCRYGQGYLFAKALDVEDATACCRPAFQKRVFARGAA